MRFEIEAPRFAGLCLMIAMLSAASPLAAEDEVWSLNRLSFFGEGCRALAAAPTSPSVIFASCESDEFTARSTATPSARAGGCGPK